MLTRGETLPGRGNFMPEVLRQVAIVKGTEREQRVLRSWGRWYWGGGGVVWITPHQILGSCIKAFSICFNYNVSILKYFGLVRGRGGRR